MTISQPLLFNPSRASLEELEQTFVGRWPLLTQLESDLLADAKTSADRHWMLVGPRGSGKSHLTELLSRRLAQNRGWSVVRLSEEQYQIANLAQLLEQIVMRLEHLTTSPFQGRSNLEVQELAIDQISSFRKKYPRPILVVLENLGYFFERKLHQPRDQKRLREILSHNAPFIMVTTATGYVDATLKESAPFYDFFHAVMMEDLSQEEVASLVEARAQWDHEEVLLSQPALVRSRVDSVFHFSGGNPRLVLDLYSILRRGMTDDLHKQLLRLLDEVTPYYQSRLRDITPQMERVLTEMALADERLTPADIGRRCHLPTSQVTANITKLEMERLVRPMGRPDGRRRYYEIRDRLLRLWMQMREDANRTERLRPLTEFFQRWYYGHADELRESAERVGHAFWKDLEAEDSRKCKEKFNTMEYLDSASLAEPSHSLLVTAIRRAREATDPDAILRETQLLRKHFDSAPIGQYRALLGYLLSRGLHSQSSYEEEIKILESVRDEATGGLRFALWDRNLVAVAWARGTKAALEIGQRACESDSNLSYLKDRLVGFAIRVGRIPDGLRWLNEFVNASNCRGCQWHVLSKAAIELIQKGLLADARKVLARMKTLQAMYPDADPEWVQDIVVLKALIGDNDKLPTPGQWLAAVRRQSIRKIPTLFLNAAISNIAHGGNAVDAFPLLVESCRRGPLSEHEIDHVAMALIDALHKNRPEAHEIVKWAVSSLGIIRLRRLFVEFMPNLCRDNPTQAAAVLQAYRCLRDAGVLASDVQPWSMAAELEIDPDRERKMLALHPETREAVDLLLRPLGRERTIQSTLLNANHRN